MKMEQGGPKCRHIKFRRRGITQKNSSYLPAYEDGTECSETSEYKIQSPGNYPEESIQHSEHGESLKSKIKFSFFFTFRNTKPADGV
jgi:hypothetical protein